MARILPMLYKINDSTVVSIPKPILEQMKWIENGKEVKWELRDVILPLKWDEDILLINLTKNKSWDFSLKDKSKLTPLKTIRLLEENNQKFLKSLKNIRKEDRLKIIQNSFLMKPVGDTKKADFNPMAQESAKDYLDRVEREHLLPELENRKKNLRQQLLSIEEQIKQYKK
jgi:hypothetical protein